MCKGVNVHKWPKLYTEFWTCPYNVEIVWNVFENNYWKAIWKFCVAIVSGLHFERTSRTSCEIKWWKMFESVIPYIIEPVEILKIVNFWMGEEQQ